MKYLHLTHVVTFPSYATPICFLVSHNIRILNPEGMWSIITNDIENFQTSYNPAQYCYHQGLQVNTVTFASSIM